MTIVRASEKRDVYEPCCQLLRQLELPVYRLSQARASQQTPGLPDLIAFTRGRPVQTTVGTVQWFPQMACIETKVPGGRQSRAQIEFQQLCRTVAGVQYLVITDPQHLADWLAPRR